MYKIIGTDCKTYGPVSAEQLRQWIAQGRANALTQTLAEGATEWKPLGALPEFIQFFPTAHPPLIAPQGQLHKTNGFATAGLIFGIASWVICCCYSLPWSILGIVFSAIALSQINRRSETHEGRGLALAGLILSISGLVFYLVLLTFEIATNNFHIRSSWHFNQFGQ